MARGGSRCGACAGGVAGAPIEPRPPAAGTAGREEPGALGGRSLQNRVVCAGPRRGPRAGGLLARRGGEAVPAVEDSHGH
ncbi:hypothetical protein NDU88_003253 [Pleurodeles waltl]|uniref:Uncharacterized protein n=1 Tax=Pleurodeles waltl TaxID=8319 RepID=A0AAV7SF99_PLEWA|nr:hypothetical protein NDU88_003253 [Pleurodeles waltl]